MIHSILGIDPGLSGALALCRGSAWALIDMPIVGDGKHHEINLPLLCGWLREQKPEHAFLEYASARPGQDVTSMFRYGCTYGALKALIAALEIPLTIVTPTRSKPAVGLLRGDDKEASRLRALQLFPEHAANLALKKITGALLAYFGLRSENSA